MADYTGINKVGQVADVGGNVDNDSDHGDMLSTMRSRMTMAAAAYNDSRDNELDDLRFMAGSPDNQWQWPSDVLATRGAVQGQTINARPCLTINKLPQHVRQVTNDQRHNRPNGKVIPADDRADLEMAKIFDGIVRHIEYISDADTAYDTACENQVIYGEGYIRVLTEYCDETSFDQELKIGRIRNSFSVYMDPTIQDPCGADARWCFVTEDISKEEYERLYPDAAPISSIQSFGINDDDLQQWLREDTVRIAEYFYVEYKSEKLNLYPNNITAFNNTLEDKQFKSMYGKSSKMRIVQREKVCWVKTNGYEVLEKRDWAGKYIPIVRVVGNEFEVNGQIHVSGIVRNAKDAQRMYNYWTSQEAEMLALAPKAPFIGYGGQFEGYETQWKTANTTNWPYLEVNPDVTDGAGGALPLPSRAQPPMASSGLMQAKSGASEDIKAATGQYNASLGMGGNERSGKAILARQREGDVGTYHYVDNLARAIRYVTRQLVDMIPKIYDTQRIARIIGEDGATDMAKIDPMQEMPVKKIVDQQGIEIDKIYNPNVGKYDVVVTTGPSYSTRRQETREEMAQLLQGNPSLWAVAGDLFVKNMDWPGADEMAKRLAKTIDPKFMSDEEDPALQAAKQQIQAMGQEMEQMHQMIVNVGKSIEMQDVHRKDLEAQVKVYDAETKRISAVQAGMSEAQIQDIAMGVVAAAMESQMQMHMQMREQPMQMQPEQPEMMQPEQPEMIQPEMIQPEMMQPEIGMPQ